MKLKLEEVDQLAVLRVLGSISVGHDQVLRAGLTRFLSDAHTHPLILDLLRVESIAIPLSQLKSSLDQVAIVAARLKREFRVVAAHAELATYRTVEEAVFTLASPFAAVLKEERSLKLKVDLLETQRKELLAELSQAEGEEVRVLLNETSQLRKRLRALEQSIVGIHDLPRTSPETASSLRSTLERAKQFISDVGGLLP